MSTFNDSVIICDTTPEPNRRKNLFRIKKSAKVAKKTFYESPLKHIQLSTTRWEQIQKQRKLMNNTRQAAKKKQKFNSLMDGGFHDSIIILSDNENESNSHNEQSNRNNNAKKRKKSLEKSRGDEVETHSRNKRKKSCSITDNNSSCLVISDTEDYDSVAVRVDNENIAPSKSMNQSSDDIAVVWSSTEPSSPENRLEGNEIHENNQDNENDYRLFMVDYTPNPQNLININGNETTSEEPIQNIANEEDQIKDSNLLFNKPGLKLPKAHDISGRIVIEKRKSTSIMLSKLERKRPKLYSQSSEVPSTSTAIPSTLQLYNKSQTTSQPTSTLQTMSQPTSTLQTMSQSTSTLQTTSQTFSNVQTVSQSTVIWESTPQAISNLQIASQPPIIWGPTPQPFNNWQSTSQPTSTLQTTSQTFNNVQTASQSAVLWDPTPQPFNNWQTTSQPSNILQTASQSSNTLQTTSQPSNKLRDIIIDGNNVAMAHKNNKVFSEEGLKLVIEFFRNRGHNVKVFIPQYRRSSSNKLLEKWYSEGIVIFTPSRYIEGKWITSYDDRYILQYATMTQGIVISLDQYRDLYRENPLWRDTIVNRLLPPTFVGDCVMFPQDPLGRNGPTLDEFLRC